MAHVISLKLVMWSPLLGRELHDKFGIQTKDHKAMNVAKLVYCSSCWYTHVVHGFFGHTMWLDLQIQSISLYMCVKVVNEVLGCIN